MFNYRGWFFSPNTTTRGQLSINFITLYHYYDADVMDNDNYTTVLENLILTSSLQVAQINMEKLSGLDHVVLAKKWGISPENALNMICHTTKHGDHMVLHPSYSRQFKSKYCQSH